MYHAFCASLSMTTSLVYAIIITKLLPGIWSPLTSETKPATGLVSMDTPETVIRKNFHIRNNLKNIYIIVNLQIIHTKQICTKLYCKKFNNNDKNSSENNKGSRV